MTLTEHEDEGCCVAEFSLRNFAPIPAFVLRWDYPVWHLAAGADATKLKKAGRPAKNAAESLLPLIPHNGITRGELLKLAKPKWGQSQLYEAVKELIRTGKVREMSHQIYVI
jgi:hypothetical protein